MKKSKSLPSSALSLTTYAELRQHLTAFVGGHLKTILIVGPPGTGKSRCLRQIVADGAVWIDGNATPLGIYCTAFEHVNQPLILDDVDGLYRDRKGVRLLKSLCQTDAVKHLSWESTAGVLDSRGIPRNFTTTSSVALIANDWQTVNADVGAVEDRAHVLHFAPPPDEIHREAATWFGDQEVFDFVGDHLRLIAEHSLRLYVLAVDKKAAGLDWRRFVLSRFLSGLSLTVAQFKTNPIYSTEEERAQAFVAAGNGCRATYFNHARRLLPRNSFPRVPLLHPVMTGTDGNGPLRHAEPRREARSKRILMR